MRGQEQWLQAARRGWMAEAGRIKTPLRGGGGLPAAQEPVGLYPALACSPDKTRFPGPGMHNLSPLHAFSFVDTLFDKTSVILSSLRS